jgi:sulfite reductase (NADPH) flavoprotein alpha-component
MAPRPTVPFIPDDAPFTPAQRAWLSGFLAGMLCRTEAPEGAAPQTAASKPTFSILFGSQSGTAEALAKRFGREAQKRGYQTMVAALEQISPTALAQQTCALIVTSTWGDGDPPDNAAAFWEKLANENDVKLSNLSYSVLALGDTNYQNFCGFGKAVDRRLEELGAKRIFERIDCTVDYEDPATRWQSGVFEALERSFPQGGSPQLNGSFNISGNGDAVLPPASARVTEKASGYSRKNPFAARLLVNRRLTREGSEKDTRHYEVCLKGSGLTYEVGDALGIMPANSPELVEEILQALGFDGE